MFQSGFQQNLQKLFQVQPQIVRWRTELNMNVGMLSSLMHHLRIKLN